MKTFTYKIEDENGMHARPAGKFAACAKQFTAKITVRSGDRESDGKRLLGLMSLGAVCGTELEISASGEDETAAIEALEHFCRQTWGKGTPV